MDQSMSLAQSLLRRLDSLRVGWLKFGGVWLKPVVRNRELRVALFGISVLLVAMAAVLIAPFWLLALGPIIWGIPHLVSDLRYLVFKPGWHRSPKFWCFIGLPILVAGVGYYSMSFGMLAVGGAIFIAHGSSLRRIIVAMLVVALSLLAWRWQYESQLIFAHLHNFIAVLLWWFWRPHRHGWVVIVPILFFAASLAIGLGWVSPLFAFAASAPQGLDPSIHLSIMAPGLAEPWGLRLVLLFAFAQAVHYGVWLRLIPEDDRAQATPRSFQATFRVLKQDLGPKLLGAAFFLACGLAIWAVIDLAEARTGYLRLALFHGYLELAIAAILFIQRSPLPQHD
jgi:hypothetical protein